MPGEYPGSYTLMDICSVNLMFLRRKLKYRHSGMLENDNKHVASFLHPRIF